MVGKYSQKVILTMQFSEHNRKLMQGYAPGEKELIEARLEEIRLKKKLEKGGNY